jgi:hypothetical protein
MTESNVPATTDEAALPAPLDAAGGVGQAPARPRRPGQNVATGLFPLTIGLLVVLFLALALWTLMTVTGGGL